MSDAASSVPVERAIDCHVHPIPEPLLEAIRDALTLETGWTYDHPIDRAKMEGVLASASVDRYFALPYGHRPEGLPYEYAGERCSVLERGLKISNLTVRFRYVRWTVQITPTH